MFWPLIDFFVALLLAFVVGTLVEYGVHRLMHSGKVLLKKHAKHHQVGAGQGWLGEFADYFIPSVAIIWVGFLYSVHAGLGFMAGATLYAALAAYAHQIQHENPDLVFWLVKPVHHLHHSEKMWKHNFGILVDVWDRVFGTYKRVDWRPEKRLRDYPLSSYFKIKWY
jgi:sterol desaturase/sphingolipid hydroxylase (fatty acid hydroxylase superfamily)